jgi:hypothetical protein
MSIAESIYLLCALTSLATAILLLRTYIARRTPLLLWSCIGFIGLAVNNVLVFVDLVLFKGVDLSFPRALAGAIGMLLMLYGFIWAFER